MLSEVKEDERVQLVACRADRGKLLVFGTGYEIGMTGKAEGGRCSLLLSYNILRQKRLVDAAFNMIELQGCSACDPVQLPVSHKKAAVFRS